MGDEGWKGVLPAMISDDFLYDGVIFEVAWQRIIKHKHVDR